MVCDNDDTEDDSDVDGSVEHSGIGELLDDLHQSACSNVCMNTAASESNSDHEYKDRKSTRLNSSHSGESRMPSSA